MSSFFGGGSSPQIVVPEEQKSKAFQTITPQSSFRNAAEYMGRLDKEYNTLLDRKYDMQGTEAEIGAKHRGIEMQERASYLASLPASAGQGVRDVAKSRLDDAKTAYKDALARAKTSKRSYVPVTQTGFDSRQYLENYKDLRDAFGDDEEKARQHYIDFGKAEGRTDADIHGLNRGTPGFARTPDSAFLPKEVNSVGTNSTQSNDSDVEATAQKQTQNKYQPKTAYSYMNKEN